MRCGARPKGAVHQPALAALLLGQRGGFLHRVRRQPVLRQQHHRRHGDDADVLEATQRVVGQRRFQRRQHRVRGAARQQQGVAVGLCARHRVGADHRGRAGAVLDNDGLAQAARQLVGQEPRHRICGAAGREGHNDLDRLLGVGGVGLARIGGDGKVERHHGGTKSSGHCNALGQSRRNRNRVQAAVARGVWRRLAPWSPKSQYRPAMMASPSRATLPSRCSLGACCAQAG
ncbi:hypothetical protein D3C71_1390370 [compost metagenome]